MLKLKCFKIVKYISLLCVGVCILPTLANGNESTTHKGVIAGGSMQSKDSKKQTDGLTVATPGEITNTRAINSKGTVSLTSGKSITNGSESAPASIQGSAVNLNAPVIRNTGTISAGSGNVIMNTSNLVNSGSISAPKGKIEVTAAPGGKVSIDNTKGTMEAKSQSFKGGTLKTDKFTLGK